MPATIAWLQKVVLILLYVAGKQGSEPGGNTDCYCSQKTSRRASESSNYDHTGMEDMENVSGFRLSSAGLSSCSLRLWIRYCYLGLKKNLKGFCRQLLHDAVPAGVWGFPLGVS